MALKKEPKIDPFLKEVNKLSQSCPEHIKNIAAEFIQELREFYMARSSLERVNFIEDLKTGLKSVKSARMLNDKEKLEKLLLSLIKCMGKDFSKKTLLLFSSKVKS